MLKKRHPELQVLIPVLALYVVLVCVGVWVSIKNPPPKVGDDSCKSYRTEYQRNLTEIQRLRLEVIRLGGNPFKE